MPPQEDIFVEKNQVNLKLLGAKMLSNWYWVVLSIIVCCSISYLYLRYTAPTFITSAKILIKSDKDVTPGEDAIAQALGGQIGASNSLEGEAEILKTRHLMEKVVRDLKSYITYSHKGQVRTVDLYKATPFTLHILGSPDSIRPVTLEVRIKGTKISLSSETYHKDINYYEAFVIPGLGKVQIEKGTKESIPDAVYVLKVNTIQQAAGALMSKLEVTIPIKQADIIALNYTNQVPQNSEDILNKLIQAYQEGNLEDKNKIADSTIAFVDSRLVNVSKELGSIEGTVQNFKQENKIADITAQSGLLVSSTGDQIEQQAKIETQLSVLNSVESYVNNSGVNERVVPSGALLDDPAFASVVERYNQIVLEKEKSSISQTENNPYMKNLNIQIASARADMLASLSGLKRTLLIAKGKIQSRSGVLAGQVKKVPAVERTYLDLSRQQEIKQELYVYLLKKKEETAISKTSNVSNCKIIEPPISSGPVSPVRTNILGYGVFLGLFLPLGIIFLGDRLNNKVSSRDQVSSYTNIPIIAEIGKNLSGSTETIVVEQGSRTPISEQFRALRTNLTFFLKDNEKTILLTSSMSGEGKSFISLNLATVLAISGKKVLVMEMDLRKPNLSNKLKLKNDFGFTNYITNTKLTIDDILTPSGTQEGLFIISSGIIPPNPTEIILNERMEALMAELRERFDYIIVDAPPIGMVTDAQLLSKYSDLTLYVVRQGYTFKEQLSIAQEISRDRKMKNISILMNDVKNESGYGYGYGYGYGFEDENKGWFSKLLKR